MRIRLRGKSKNGENHDLIVKKNLIWMKEKSCKILRYATVFAIVTATSMTLSGCDYDDIEAYYDVIDDIDTDSEDFDLSKILDDKDISADDLEDISDLIDQLGDEKTSDEGTDGSTNSDDNTDLNLEDLLGDKDKDCNKENDCNKKTDCNNKENDCNKNKCDQNKDCKKDTDSDKDKASDQSTECNTDTNTGDDKKVEDNKDTGDDQKKPDCDQNTDSTENNTDTEKDTDTEKETDKEKDADKEKTDDSANKEDSTDKPDDSKGNVSDNNNGGEPLPSDGREPMDSKYAGSYRTFDDEGSRRNREAIGLTDASIDELKKQQEGYYAYSRLSDGGKTLYVELLQIINKEASEIYVSTRNPEAMQLAFDYLMMDHPEIFWVNGYRYVKHFTYEGGIDKLAFTGVYTYDLNEVANRQAKMQEYIDTCLAGAPSTDDEYFVIKYIYDYLIANTEYDLRAPDNQNICSVFLNRKTVCSGYARATQYLLNKLGVKCTYVTGMADNGSESAGLHAWNLVRCNGEYYYMDTTWGDTGMTGRDGKPRINYDYLNATEKAMSVNHKLSDRIDYPDCSSTKDSYYARENRYMSSPDMTQVQEMFAQEYQSGGDNVTVKCESKDTYNSLYEQLIKDGAVYDYLEGDKQFSYTLYEDSNTIAIWIK